LRARGRIRKFPPNATVVPGLLETGPREGGPKKAKNKDKRSITENFKNSSKIPQNVDGTSNNKIGLDASMSGVSDNRSAEASNSSHEIETDLDVMKKIMALPARVRRTLDAMAGNFYSNLCSLFCLNL
jgi:hypothetical protein